MIEQMENQAIRLILPAYEEIPDVGLFLDQVCRYINGFLQPLSGFELTTSMISNYVKKDLIANPVKKLYGREQIASLLFIAIAKSVLSIEDIQMMLRLQQMTYPLSRAYDYFRLELQNVLEYVFEQKEEMEVVGVGTTREKAILRNTIIAVAHKIYLNRMLRMEAERKQADNEKAVP